MTDKTLAEIIEHVEGMKKHYAYSDDGFDADVPFSKYVSSFDQAISDVLSYLNSLKKERNNA